MPRDQVDPGRRSLLKGRLQRDIAPLRPPYTSNGQVLDACVSCGACAAACSEGIIVAGNEGYPELDFRKGECTFCGECADACQAPVFDLTREIPWSQAAHIANGCFTRMGIVCQSCRDACPQGAIAFTIKLGGPSRPHVDTATCTGCGACVSPCPAGAVTIVPANGREEANRVR